MILMSDAAQNLVVMSESAPESPQPPAPPPAPSSLAARLVNVYATPGDVFEEVARSPRDNGNWVLPLILTAIMSVVFCFVVFSQENVMRNFHQTQEQAIRDQVKAGKVPADKADDIVEAARKWMSPTIMAAFGSVGSLIATVGGVFFVALILMLLGRYALNAEVEFMKMAEVSGLAAMIALVGTVAKMFVVMATGRMELGVSPAALVEDFDPGNHTHALLGILDLSMIWYVAVLSAGLARVCGKPWWRAAAWLYAIWLVFAAGMAAVAYLGARAH
ncbi:MAG: YIP1 family protein [Verrucomicrobia bacterium]|nr:YIP1 family protein [Verrucomicrobiota bacterium]